MCMQVPNWRIYGGKFRESTGCWLAEKCANEGSGNGWQLGHIVGRLLRVHVGIHDRARKVRQRCYVKAGLPRHVSARDTHLLVGLVQTGIFFSLFDEQGKPSRTKLI